MLILKKNSQQNALAVPAESNGVWSNLIPDQYYMMDHRIALQASAHSLQATAQS